MATAAPTPIPAAAPAESVEEVEVVVVLDEVEPVTVGPVSVVLAPVARATL